MSTTRNHRRVPVAVTLLAAVLTPTPAYATPAPPAAERGVPAPTPPPAGGRLRSAGAVSSAVRVGSGRVPGVVRARSAAPGVLPSADARVEAYLDQIRKDPGRLREFLKELPKGADIHSHLSGAAATSRLIGFAERDGLCVDTKTYTATAPPCAAGRRPAVEARKDTRFHDRILRAWSMAGFVPGRESGHDHFFATFGKFGPASSHNGEMLAAFASQAAAEHEYAVEVFSSAQAGAARTLGRQTGYDKDLATMRNRMLAPMTKLVAAARAETDKTQATMRTTLRCGKPHADPACALPVRLDFQVQRTSPPAEVFAGLLLAFELAEHDDRYVGVNLVAPEDDPVARRDYRLHMRMIGYLRGIYHKAQITLHAGELVKGLVPKADLRFHIRAAVETGHATRIGHGVDIAGETNSKGLLREMARKHVLVEIGLTSNCQILKVCGAGHPFALYRKAHVPVALITDDEGVEHTDLTSEYVRAVRTFKLTYKDLRTLGRAALDHSFLQGRSLWRAPDDYHPAAPCAHQPLGAPGPTSACAALLAASPKATAEWRQEAGYAAFVQRYGR